MTLDNTFLGLLAGIISLGGFIPYIMGILKKKVVPHRVTWTIWTFIGTMLLIDYISASGGINASIWVPIGYVVGPAIIMFLSFHFGEGGYSYLDIGSGILSLISIVLWIITGTPLVALITNIVADAFAAVPTVFKTYHRPETESLPAWGLFLIGNFLNLFVLPKITFGTAIYPFYLFVISLLIFVLGLRKYFLRQ